MSVKIKIDGMHCAACVNLIKMEIEEIGLEDKIESLELFEKDNYGQLIMTDIEDTQINDIFEAIKQAGDYKPEVIKL